MGASSLHSQDRACQEAQDPMRTQRAKTPASVSLSVKGNHAPAFQGGWKDEVSSSREDSQRGAWHLTGGLLQACQPFIPSTAWLLEMGVLVFLQCWGSGGALEALNLRLHYS